MPKTPEPDKGIPETASYELPPSAFERFRQAQIPAHWQPLRLASAWILLLAWLYFVFVHHSLLAAFAQGQIVMVDVLLGLPLVLLIALYLFWLPTLVLKVLVMWSVIATVNVKQP